MSGLRLGMVLSESAYEGYKDRISPILEDEREKYPKAVGVLEGATVYVDRRRPALLPTQESGPYTLKAGYL